jgi:hypothetical protein
MTTDNSERVAGSIPTNPQGEQERSVIFSPIEYKKISPRKTERNNLSPEKSIKLKKNKNVDEDKISTYNKLLSIALKVDNIEEENKATQRAVALLRQLVSILVQFHEDELARNREKRF